MSNYDRRRVIRGSGTMLWPPVEPVAVVDMDSTVCDTRHRRHLAPVGPNKSLLAAWEKYSLGCPGDSVILGAATLIRLLHGPNLVFLLTSRNDIAEQESLNWLAANHLPFDRLRMRAPDEDQPDNPTDWKVAVVDQWMREGWNIQLFIDDWAETCTAITERLGVPTLTPAFLAGDYKPGH